MDRFTDDQIREFNDAFHMFDHSGKGYIMSTELREMLKTIGFNPTDKLLEEMTIIVDLDGNGEIDFDEFVDLIDKLENDETAVTEAQAAFNAFDVLGKGFVEANDLKSALKHILNKAPESDLQGIIETFKLEKNRKITFEEFKSMMTLKRN